MKWIVAGNSRYGHPGPFAEKVHHAIEMIAFEQGYPIQNPIRINITDICRRIGLLVWDKTKKRYVAQSRDRKRVKDAIRSIRFAAIVCEKAFRLEGSLQSLDTDASLYTRTAFRGETSKGETIEESVIFLADWYLSSLNDGYFRPIDYTLILQLSDISGAAPKLYKYLAYQFALRCFWKGGSNESYIEVPYSEIRQIIDLAEESSIKKAQGSFEKVHRALLDAGFIEEPVEWIGEGRSAKDYSIRYVPGPKARKEFKDGRKALDTQYQLNLFQLPEGSPLADKLKDMGVDPDGISRLLKGHTDKKIRAQIEHYDWLVLTGKKPSNPAGWIYKAITQGYKIPKGVQQLKAEREAQAIRQNVQAMKEKQRLEEEARTKAREAEYAALDERLSQLADGGESILQEVCRLVEQNASNFEKGLLREGTATVKSMIFKASYYAYVEQLLNQGGH